MNDDGTDPREEQPETKSRARRVALILLLLGIAGATLYLVLRSQAPDPTPALALAQVTEIPGPTPVDTPPLRPGSGWPFAQLPHIAKFEAPVPRMSLTLQPRPLAVPEKIPVRSWPPPPEAPGDVPLWVVAPLAAGAYLVNADVSGTESVVPEPATVLLLGTGMLLLGIQVVLRRRQVPATSAGVTRAAGRTPRQRPRRP